MVWWEQILTYFWVFIVFGVGALAGEMVPNSWSEFNKRRVQWSSGVLCAILIFWVVEGKGGDLHQISRMRVGDFVIGVVGVAVGFAVLIGVLEICRRLYTVAWRKYGQTAAWHWFGKYAVVIYSIGFVVVTPILLLVIRANGYGY